MFKRKKEKDYVFMRKTRGEIALHSVAFIVMAIWALSYLFPVVWMLIQSLYTPEYYLFDVMTNGKFSFPKHISFNYIRALTELKYEDSNLLAMFFNSLWYVGLGITYCAFWNWIVAYIFAKYKFKGRELLYTLIIFTLIVPVYGGEGAHYKIINWLQLYDTGPLMVITTGIGGFGGQFLVFYGIFKSVSWEYAESVFIDGGGHNTVFFKIMLPIAMPALGALIATSLITYWNEYYTFLMYWPSWPSVATGLYLLSIQSGRVGVPIYNCGLVLCALPCFIVFSLSVDSMMKNLTIGGIKG